MERHAKNRRPRHCGVPRLISTLKAGWRRRFILNRPGCECTRGWNRARSPLCNWMELLGITDGRFIGPLYSQLINADGFGGEGVEFAAAVIAGCLRPPSRRCPSSAICAKSRAWPQGQR